MPQPEPANSHGDNPSPAQSPTKFKLRLAGELVAASQRLNHLAGLVDETGLSAGEVGRLFLEQFRQSETEHSYDIRKGVADMMRSEADAPTFSLGLRQQALRLTERAATVLQSAVAAEDAGDANSDGESPPHKPR
jgi:hypothetical protein